MDTLRQNVNPRWSGSGLLALLLVAFARGDEPPTAEITPPAATSYYGREIAQTMHYLGASWLVRESRDREEDCAAMLSELKVRPGMAVCDMGCGNGFYTVRLAELVGERGKVIGVDIQPEMLRFLAARVEEQQIGNIEPILGTADDPRLKPGSLDLILCVDVYHEFSHPEQMLAAMRKALKPSGQLVLVEFRAEDPQVPIKPLHKMTKRQVLRELEPNGLQLVRQFDGLPWQHMMFFQAESRAAGGDEKR